MTTCTWLINGDRQRVCGLQAVAHVEYVCLHEHISDDDCCAEHYEQWHELEGMKYCSICWDASCKYCRITTHKIEMLDGYEELMSAFQEATDV